MKSFNEINIDVEIHPDAKDVDHDEDHRDDEQDEEDEDFELRCHWRKLRRQSRRRSALREITPMSWKQSHYHCYRHVSIHFNHF